MREAPPTLNGVPFQPGLPSLSLKLPLPSGLSVPVSSGLTPDAPSASTYSNIHVQLPPQAAPPFFQGL